jgi:dipeptidyl aminopeptidase/acylaminoacyl peptidase
MSFDQRGVAAILAVVAVACAAPALAAPPPIEHFTRLAAIDQVVISPSGLRLAVIVFSPSGYKQVGVMDLDPIGKPRVVGSFEDADVSNVRWVSDDRLVFQAFQRGYEIRAGGGGTFAVDHDGSALRALIAFSYAPGGGVGSMISTKVLPYEWLLHSTTDDGTEDAFVFRRALDLRGALKRIELARLNTRTGVLRSLSHGMPEGARDWLLDAKDDPRFVTAYVEGRTKIYWRPDNGETPWTEVADFDPLHESSFALLTVDIDGRVIVSRRGDDGSGLYAYDPRTRRIDPEPLVALKGFDMRPVTETDSRTKRLVGAHVSADRQVSVWFDAALERIQRSVDAALPKGRTNLLYCGRCESSRFIAVRSSSDRQPGEYFLFDRAKSSLERIGAERPWIDEATQGHRTFHRVTMRDGLSMPVVVTHPADAKPDAALPAVVVVHGGPWTRGAYVSWNAGAQFLASRGYRVLEPEYRGSEGYGLAHFKAGWKQWGRAMQDDLVDAVQWAAKQKLVDPARVCIYGANYGGYASLMAPITHPGVFRCAASLAGFTDIDLMYSINWTGFTEASKRYGMPVLIGDREKDAAMLAAASPLKRAAEIKVPVLLAHGAADRYVPIDHAKEFVSAAQKTGVDVETVYYNGEGQGLQLPENWTDFYRRLEKFFATALKASP